MLSLLYSRILPRAQSPDGRLTGDFSGGSHTFGAGSVAQATDRSPKDKEKGEDRKLGRDSDNNCYRGRAKPNASFICIEPWLGIADHENTDGNFLKKDGLISLQIGKIFTAQYSIEIEE